MHKKQVAGEVRSLVGMITASDRIEDSRILDNLRVRR